MGQYLKNEITEALNQETYFAELGLSFDSVFGETRVPVLVGQPIQSTAAPSEQKDIFFYEFASNQQDFSKITEASASGKGSFGFGKAKASASRKKFFSSNSYSCYILGYIRLVHPKFHFDLRNTTLEHNFESFLKNNQRKRIDEVERKVGDEVITSVTLCSEILVKVEIQSYNEKQKDEIKASASASGTFASGGAKFSSIVNKIKSSKKIAISVFGDIPSQFIENTTPEAIDKFLIDFAKNSVANFSILEFNSEPISNIPQLLNFKDIVDNEELEKRKEFVSTIDNLYEDLLDWKEDILYATSESNKGEFADDIRNYAKSDLQSCENYIKKLDDFVKNARQYWLTNGNNGNVFDLNSIKNFPTEFPIYERIIPIVPAPSPQPKPQPKPRRERADHQTDRPGIGGRW